MPLRIWLWVIIMGMALAACESEAPESPASEPLDGAAQVVRQTPEDVLEGFMQAWNEKDINAMYAFVSDGSRTTYPIDVFGRRYKVAEDALSLTGVSYTIDSVKLQGQTAVVNYDVELKSPLFGEIEDPDRIMRMTQVENGWQIAWTPMDIIKDMASEVSVQVLPSFPPRGNIYDRNGNYVVEEGGTIVTVSVIQQDMSDIAECIDLLSRVMKWERADMQRLFDNYNLESLFNVGEIDTTTYTTNRGELEEKCGVADESSGFRKIDTYVGRSYVGHGSGVHITGYMGRIPANELPKYQAKGYQAGDMVGISGIEEAYQDDLAGRPGREIILSESGGMRIRTVGSTTLEKGVPVQLTIDMDLQNAVAQALIDAHNTAANNWATVANGGAVVVMKVDTGEILALASYPFFDPSVFNPESSYENATEIINDLVNDPRQPLANKALQEQYTPGSVYKIFTEVATANENIFPPDDLFNCELTWEGPNYGDQAGMRQDWRVVDEMDAAGMITMSQALTTSCNPFFWEMGGKMYQRDTDMHLNYVKEFGFGSRTGLSMLSKNEAAGNLADPQNATEAINNAIGQGSVQVTAVQLATAVTAIANRGTLYKPYIVKQVGGFDGTMTKAAYDPVVVRKMDNIKPEVFDIVFEGMCNVPIDEELGTSWLIFNGSGYPPSYTSCGKTGTAETGNADSGRPPNAWYATFAPAEKPEIVVVVVVPTSREGSEVAAPIARRILDHYFRAQEAPFPEWWWKNPYFPVKPPVGVG
jgi:penicillin-binding protein 2